MNIDTKLAGLPTTAFIDTGATISIISSTLVNKLKLRPDPNTSITIKQLDGSTRSMGRISLPLSINSITKSVTLHVIKDFSYPFLIGLDIGQLFGLNIDLRKFTVSIPSKEPSQPVFTLSTDENKAIEDILKQRSNAFSLQDNDIGRIKIARHSILTRPHHPIYLRPHRRPQHEYDQLQREVDQLIAKGLVRPSNSPYAFPVMGVPKKDGTLRLVVDYRRLNAITIPDKMPIPRVDDIIDRLHGARYFTTLDIAWGYWHVEMDPNSIQKTAFVTNQGHYEWMVMPMGLMNAGATFQRIIQQILGPHLYKGAINYLDDIILYSETFEEHIKLLNDVLRLLEENNIKLKMSKCMFAKQEVTYLGYNISYNQVRPLEEKVKAIREFPVPTSVTSIRRFLGMSQYYRRFIPNFSQIAKPLTNLTKKDVPYEWGPEQQAAFQKLIDRLTSQPVVAIYNPKVPCTIHTDASAVGIGATLSQRGSDGLDHPIEYFSRQLNDAQRNYNASELECLAIVEAVRHFEAYLNLPFTIVTDHSALQWLLSLQRPKGRLYRWSVELSTFKFTIQHRPGLSQAHVDALSRAPVAFHLEYDELHDAQKNADLSFLRAPVDRRGITTILQRGRHKAYVPEPLRQTLLYRMHDGYGHPGQSKTIRMISSIYWWPNIVNDIRRYVSSCQPCQLTTVSHQPSPGEYIMPENDLEPLDQISLDTIVLGSAARKTAHKNIQVFVDNHSRYIWAYPTRTNSAATFVTLLTNLFNAGIKPKRLLTDCHKSFLSNKLRKLLNENHVKLVHSTPYHPQTNGIVERANGTLVSRLRPVLLEKPSRKWSTQLPDVVRNYNRTPHDVTGFTPEYLLFGIDTTPTFATPITNLDEARTMANQRTRKVQLKHKATHDAKHPPAKFELGDRVLKQVPSNHPDQDKLTPRWTGPYYIIAEIGPVTYDISETLDGRPIRAHASQLKPFHSREPASS